MTYEDLERMLFEQCQVLESGCVRGLMTSDAQNWYEAQKLEHEVAEEAERQKNERIPIPAPAVPSWQQFR